MDITTDEFVRFSVLSTSGPMFSFASMLYLWCVAMQFGPGHVRFSLTGHIRTGPWQIWGFRSYPLFLTSLGLTYSLLSFAEFDISAIRGLVMTDLACWSAACVLQVLNLVTGSSSAFPSYPIQWGIFAAGLISVVALGSWGVFSAIRTYVIEASVVGLVFGLVTYYPLSALQKAEPKTPSS